MKKKLVASLAAAMVLGVAGTSFAAANPFVDVPAKHWAYASVMTLSQAGIVDGYNDGKFQGDKMISRYEMAQIVAKAMAKSDKADAKLQAEITKLATEFAEELNVIGVRVTALEKNASKIKIEGETRLRYNWADDANTTKKGDVAGSEAFDWRQRLNMNAQVSPDIKYTARLEAVGRLGSGNAAVNFNRNYFTVSDKLGMDQILVGKMGLYVGKFLAVGKTSNNDGVAVNTKVGALDLNAFWTAQQKNADFKGAYLSKNTKTWDFGVGYLAADETYTDYVPAVFDPAKAAVPFAVTAPSSTALDVGTWISVSPHVSFVGEYVKTNADNAVDGNAYGVQLSYSTGTTPIKQFFSTKDIVNKNNAHEQGIAIAYRSIEKNGLPGKGQYGQYGNANVTNYAITNTDDVKGLYLGYQNAMQKNVLLNIEYQDLKTKSTGKDLNKTAEAYVTLYF